MIAAAGLGAMTYRFPEMWFVQGLVDCDFDEGVEQLTRLFVNALGLGHLPQRPQLPTQPRTSSPTEIFAGHDDAPGRSPHLAPRR